MPNFTANDSEDRLATEVRRDSENYSSTIDTFARQRPRAAKVRVGQAADIIVADVRSMYGGVQVDTLPSITTAGKVPTRQPRT